MPLLILDEIRNKFIEYFVKNAHTHVPASSLIPHNDSSLMFVNSGMVQFKNVFTGQEKRDYKRAVTSQKSIRAGGKHNDLDNVGYTARHHTFFEMLGNFSFGDYFKEKAIYYAWDLLTKELGITKDKLYVTVYHTDEEAAALWGKIAGLGNDRIIKIKTVDNFWAMGDTGPCGPCSEIFYDHGEKVKGGLPGSDEEDGDRYVEIWNLVFMQFEQVSAGSRRNLAAKSVDTGMGLERIAAVIQGVTDNYDIDLFKEIINYTESIVKIKAQGEARFSYRVIADHLRSCAFLIADGITPSNEGRGYVLRRIMRRAMRHAQHLEAKEPLMYKLLPKLIELMGGTYPELQRAENLISEALKHEEIRFKSALEKGLSLLEEEVSKINKNENFSGEVAFKLYDTFGFPLDLTEDILKSKKITVEVEGFNRKMQEQRERARSSWGGSGEAKIEQVWFDIKAEFVSSEFLGYSLEQVEGKVLALVKNGNCVQEVSNLEEEFILVANQTPFYGEAGGQKGDTGFINSKNCKIEVIDTVKRLGSIIGHVCVLKQGSINVGDEVCLAIDARYRHDLRAHHSATHLLHAVLREMLGQNVTQKGSLVASDRLRFDFSYPSSLSIGEINLIEDKVNDLITQNSPVSTVIMLAEDAINGGAMALFGEKYDREVRVVSMGRQALDNKSYSFELCGGTHASRTGDIGAFKIVSESAVAAGVRRIEAVCGHWALKLARENDNLLKSIADILKTTRNEIPTKVSEIITAKKETEKELLKTKLAALNLNNEQIAKQSVELLGVKLIYKTLDDMEPSLLRAAALQLIDKADDLIVVYVSNLKSKLSITVAVSSKITNKFQANILANKISLFLGGTGGGGQVTIAQAGATDVSKLPKLQDKITNLLTPS